jgi:hypothetical protein
VPLRKLRTLSLDEARAYFDAWVARAPGVAEDFRRSAEAAGVPANHPPRYRPDDLTPLWVLVVGRVETVDVVPDVPLPPWAAPGRPPEHAERRFELSPDSLWLLDGLVCYFGEVVLRNNEGAYWELADEPRLRKIYLMQNWPVIAGLPSADVNPVGIVVGRTESGCRRPRGVEP